MKIMMLIAVGAAAATMGMINGVASADTACKAQPAAIYFEKGKSEVTPTSKAVVEHVAAQARSCALPVIAEAPNGRLQSARAASIERAFAQSGVHVVVTRGSAIAPIASVDEESIKDRVASVRIAAAGPVG